VGVDHAGRDVEARAGDAPHAEFAVVVPDVLAEPVDRVVSVDSLVSRTPLAGLCGRTSAPVPCER
jgi:hypothetical protein